MNLSPLFGTFETPTSLQHQDFNMVWEENAGTPSLRMPAAMLKVVRDALGIAIRIHAGSIAIYGVLLPMDGLRGQQSVHHQGRSLHVTK